MSKGFSLKVDGIKTIIADFKNYPKEVADKMDTLIADEAAEMVARAQADAPVDESFLKQQIQPERLGDMFWEVSAAAGYSPFIEFGTKRNFNNPYPGIDSSQYKGSGGKEGGKGFYENILAWVKRKGFAATSKKQKGRRRKSEDIMYSNAQEEAAAHAIYLHIMRHGIKPHPFFFKNYFIASDNIIKGAEKIIKDLD